MTRGHLHRAGAGALAAVLVLGACGPAGDAPRLSGFQCSMPDACQSPDDPFLLHMKLEFDDPDGDLGPGEIQVFLDGRAAGTPQPLAPLFEAHRLPPDATSGLLYVDIGLHLESVRDGMDFLVALEVRDEVGHVSNRPGVTFRLDLR